MKNKSTIILISVLFLFIGGITVWSLVGGSKESEVKDQNGVPQIDISPGSFDFGKVSQAAGVVSKIFRVENKGSNDLIINGMVTSCGCTSASLVVDGRAGPRFGMHNKPTNWSATIKPGESAELEVYYDPNVHIDFRGRATREIIVFSNDENEPRKKIRISLNQVD